MMFRRSGQRFEEWAVIRARMLRETELFLEQALRHPERQVIIPALEVGRASFPRGFACAFWAQILGTS